jgi:hypothetical protein
MKSELILGIQVRTYSANRKIVKHLGKRSEYFVSDVYCAGYLLAGIGNRYKG